MDRFKTTTLITLDCHAAAFCQAVCHQLEGDFTVQQSLVQAQAVVYDRQQIHLSANLATVADFRFNLQLLRQAKNQVTLLAAKALFQDEKQIQSLQSELIQVLQAARNQNAIALAQQQGIEVSKQHRIYILMSAANPCTRAIVIEFSRLIRWLLIKRFPTLSYSLEAVVLLPGLFTYPEAPDYAATYALLKELDYSQTTQIPAFDNHWLLDSCNSQGIQTGSLTENLINYADVFVGFLTSEIDSIGLLIGTKKVRDKIAVYSTFGYGELIFPVEIAIARLNSALAIDIISHAFLAKSEQTPESYRQLILTVKTFVLAKDFTKILTNLEQPQGRVIWQNFEPKLDYRAGMAQEYINSLQYHHQQFETQSLLQFKQELETASKQVQTGLEILVEQLIERCADDTPNGLNQSLQLLEILVNPVISADADILEEYPQNLITKQREFASYLDPQLGIVANNNHSKSLLDELQGIHRKIKTIEDNYLIFNAAGNNLETEDEQLISLKEKLASVYKDYQLAVEFEEFTAYRERSSAIATTRQNLSQAIIEAELKVLELEPKLAKASEQLDKSLQEKRQFLLFYLILYPAIAGVVLVLISTIPTFAGIWHKWLQVLIWFIMLLLVTWAVIFTNRSLEINKYVKQAQKRYDSIKRSQNAAIITLRNAHHKQLRLEYDIYVQKLREGIIKNLINLVKNKAKSLHNTILELKEFCQRQKTNLQSSVLSTSVTRRSIISVADLDNYYHRVIDNPTNQANIFTEQIVSRSQAYQIPIKELIAKLEDFTRTYFEQLKQLSIDYLLLYPVDLISQAQAQLLSKQLAEVAEPLLYLHRVELEVEQERSRDVNLWIKANYQEQILQLYSQFYPEITIQNFQDRYKLKILTRCLGFPAYFINSLEFYAECYEHSVEIEPENKSLPDLIPSELSIDTEIRAAWQELLLAIALGIVTQDASSNYIFNSKSLGSKRRQIAKKLATEFTSQQIYIQLKEQLESNFYTQEEVYQKLERFLTSASNLENPEIEIYNSLIQAYNPLN